MSTNVQNCIYPIPGASFWNYTEPWIMADPNEEGVIYVVAADDPDSLGGGDAGDVYVVRSEDHGLTWSSPPRADDGPGETYQFLPTASIDPVSGRIIVAWYDNRSGTVNGNGNYLLDYRYAISADGAQTFSPSIVLSDVPFDPDDGAWYVRFTDPPPETNWIGEYFGIALRDTVVYAVWTGNGGPGQPQETIFELDIPTSAPMLAEQPPAAIFVRPSHPEPFTSETVIEYRLARPGPVRMSVYDVAGREVANLVDVVQEPGTHQVAWDGRSKGGEPSPSAVYFVILQGEGWELTEKVVLVR